MFFSSRRIGLCAAVRELSIMSSASSRRCLSRPNDVGSKRFINIFMDYQWAVEPLKKMGLELKSSPRTEEDIKMAKALDEPSEHIKELVDELINLDFLELAQFQRRFHRRTGVKREATELAFHQSIDRRNIRAFVMGGGMGGGGGGGGAAGSEAAGDDAAPAKAVEKDAFDLKLAGFDAKAKIKIIKEVRAITGLGLKEAKELVEKSPCVLKEGLKKDEAEALKKILVEAGAEVELV